MIGLCLLRSRHCNARNAPRMQCTRQPPCYRSFHASRMYLYTWQVFRHHISMFKAPFQPDTYTFAVCPVRYRKEPQAHAAEPATFSRRLTRVSDGRYFSSPNCSFPAWRGFWFFFTLFCILFRSVDRRYKSVVPRVSFLLFKPCCLSYLLFFFAASSVHTLLCDHDPPRSWMFGPE